MNDRLVPILLTVLIGLLGYIGKTTDANQKGVSEKIDTLLISIGNLATAQAAGVEIDKQHEVRITILEKDQKVNRSNILLNCNYGEPTWPSHSKCIR